MIPIPENAAHWHIVLVHMPMIFFKVSAIVMVLATLWKDGRWQRVALGFLIAAVLLTGAAFQSGESAEDIVEQTIPDAEPHIHPHEEIAETARNIIIPFGILMLILLWFTRKHTLLPVWASWGSVVVMTGIIILLLNVASAGGKINHPEVRGGAAIQMQNDDDDSGRGRGRSSDD